MKRISCLFVSLVCTFILVGSFCLTPEGPACAEECRLVRLYGAAGPNTTMRIEPDVLWVAPGACVIWVNLSRAAEALVIFEEGKVCQDATESPTGFQLNAKSCFVTNFIPHGATSSLKFMQEGTYNYRFEGAGATPAEGRIIVKKTDS
jgi:hypothetical protein